MAIRARANSTVEDYDAVLEITKETKSMTDNTKMKETHTIIRTLSSNPDNVSSYGVGSVDAYLNTWLAQGWYIISVHYLGNPPEGWLFAWMLAR